MTLSGSDPRVLDLPRLYVVALTAVHAEDDAWDAVQEAVLAVLQSPREHRSRPCLCELVRSLARKGATTQLKTIALRDLPFPPAVGDDPAKLAQEKECRQILLTAIQELPDRLKRVVSERHLEGRRVPEIANRIGVSQRSIRYRLRDAQDVLRRRIEHDRD